MKRALLLSLLLLPAAQLHADVEINRRPDFWIPKPPSEAMLESLEKGHLECQAFFVRNDGVSGSLTYSIQKSPLPYDLPTYNGKIEGLKQGLSKGRKAKSKSFLKNELVKRDGLELVDQEFETEHGIGIVLNQVTPSGISQVMVTCQPAERDEMVEMAYGLFTPVPPPAPSAFERGRRVGEAIGKASVFVTLFVAAVAAVILMIVQQKRRRRKLTPPPLP